MSRRGDAAFFLNRFAQKTVLNCRRFDADLGEDGYCMGEIVPFRVGERRRVTAEPPQGSAQILFFLGVRYCRGDDDPDGRPIRRGPVAPRSRRKKRA